MADNLMQPTWDPLVLAAQLQKIAKQSQTLMQRFLSNQPAAIKLGMGDTSTRLYSGPVKFVLSASGHMAGVISALGSKCDYWANDNLPPSPDEWFAGATPHLGSWWPVWDEWVTQLDSGRVPAREPGGGKLTIIEDAPGSYVRVRWAA